MESKSKGATARGLTIKGYVGLWVGSVLVSFLVLISAWYITQAELRRMRQRVSTDERALDTGRLLESALLAEGREDLLWRATGEARHRARQQAALGDAAEMARGLETEGVSPDERQLVEEIRERIRTFGAEAAPETSPRSGAALREADELLAAAGRYVRKNQSDIDETLRAALRLQAVVDYSSIGVVVFAGVVLTVGSVGLIRRVVRPTIELTRVAQRFGQRDFAARATIARDDELGALCRTLNAMAEDIADHEKARLEFVASVAHDIKNPLVTIGGAARRLRRNPFDPEQQAAWLDRIIKQVARLENLTHDLMDTVQVSAGHLTLRKTEFDLAGLIRDVRCEQAEIFPRHTLVLEGTGECRILGDKHRLERVAINLISNAAKYSPEGSPVLLKVAQERVHAVFSVRDQGAGMSPEDLKILFQPFGRGAHAHQMARGTGLGMSIVKDILEAHGGTIDVQSGIGVGTTVEVRLPLAEG